MREECEKNERMRARKSVIREIGAVDRIRLRSEGKENREHVKTINEWAEGVLDTEVMT